MKKFIAGALVSVFIALSFSSCCCCPLTKTTKKETISAVSSRITLDCYEETICAGDRFQIIASCDDDVTLNWKSSNKDVATVNSKGLVTAVAEGVATITCYADDYVDAVCTVTVTPAKNENASNPTASDDFIFPQSSTRYLTESEIKAKLGTMSGYSPSGSYAQDAINEIYARNGYVFQKENTSSYYNAQSWYQPDPNFSAADFNDYETKNITLLKQFV